MTKKEFYQRLLKHDWFHQYSGDYSVVRRGEREEQELFEIAVFNDWENLFNDVYSYNINGWPQLPDENELECSVHGLRNCPRC